MYPVAFAAEVLVVTERAGRSWAALLPAALLLLPGLGIVAPRVALGWLAAVIAVAASGQAISRRYRAADSAAMTLRDLRRAEWIITAYSLSAGVVWGAASQLMVAGWPEYDFFVLIVCFAVGMAADSVSMYSPAHKLAMALPMLLVLLLPLPAMFPRYALPIGALAVLSTVFNLVAAGQRSRILIENLRLRREQERLLEQQRAETARADQANRDKSAFLAAASHDLRQPLHALMLTSHALGLRGLDGDSRQMVERILAAGRVLAQQFDQLLDLSRLEGGSYRVQFGSVPVGHLLQQSFLARRQIAEDKALRLRLRIDRRARRLLVHSDPALLARIVDNLLDNAIKYTAAGRGVLLSLRLRGGGLWLAVHDQGIGIEPGQLEQVFKPYVQLGNPARDPGRGVGLGLSIVQNAARLIGAGLDVRSTPDRGSCFALRLPAGLLRGSAARAPEAAAPSAERLRGKRLLLVEDDAMVAAALAPWFERWGLRHRHYADPAQVPDDAAPDLIVSDIRLPGGRDGIAWLGDWLARWPEARGLLMSGEINAAQRAEQEGLMMLAKPADPALLLGALAAMSEASPDGGVSPAPGLRDE